MLYHVFYRTSSQWHHYFTASPKLADAEEDARYLMTNKGIIRTRIIPHDVPYERPPFPTD